MKKLLFVLGIVFVITLAIVIGTRLSPDALAVVVGIVAGVLASVPTTAILVWVLRQRDRQMQAQLGQNSSGHYPPVIVVNGPGTPGYGQSPVSSALSGNMAAGGPRDFKVIGQERTESTGDELPPFWEP